MNYSRRWDVGLDFCDTSILGVFFFDSGLAEAFIGTFKRDYVNGAELRLHPRAQVAGKCDSSTRRDLRAGPSAPRCLALHLSLSHGEQAHVIELGAFSVLLSVL